MLKDRISLLLDPEVSLAVERTAEALLYGGGSDARARNAIARLLLLKACDSVIRLGKLPVPFEFEIRYQTAEERAADEMLRQLARDPNAGGAR